MCFAQLFLVITLSPCIFSYQKVTNTHNQGEGMLSPTIAFCFLILSVILFLRGGRANKRSRTGSESIMVLLFLLSIFYMLK